MDWFSQGAKEGANHREENLGRAGRTECKVITIVVYGDCFTSECDTNCS